MERKYIVRIVEALALDVVVDASSSEEAKSIVENQYGSGDLTLSRTTDIETVVIKTIGKPINHAEEATQLKKEGPREY